MVSSRCSDKLSSNYMEERICCVCDGLYPFRDIVTRGVARCKALVKAMQQRLKCPADLPVGLREYYSASDLAPEFNGLLFSCGGIRVKNGVTTMKLCRPCAESLQNRRLTKCPQFAIANGLYIGKIPDKFSDTTMTENTMLNQAQPMRYLAVVRGGKHSSLRSHAYMFCANPDCPAQLLFRRVISEGIVRVVLIGAMTPKQITRMKKKFEVRRNRIQRQLRWYRKHTHKIWKIQFCQYRLDWSSDGSSN
ncbi:hypothetical protein PHMEG_0001462 [Phytophthora megakarya]|uniref:DUF6570 domain-containing protein n=1 Tax=Phytophthora megakarya TaxID=4795 RepID=A0A225X330_9STRA|nr:hypothetical protein PHMEG_0001462 [Phytophthora megakarya]